MSAGLEISRGRDNRSDGMKSASTLLESNRTAIPPVMQHQAQVSVSDVASEPRP